MHVLHAYHALLVACSCMIRIDDKRGAKSLNNCIIRFRIIDAISLTKRKCLATVTIILAIVNKDLNCKKELIRILVSLLSELRLFFLFKEGNGPKLSLYGFSLILLINKKW